ncbi:MAG: permease [bacterium]|nr:permease [bacterium]
MQSTIIIINTLALLLLGAAFIKDSARACQALRIALRSFLRILPSVLMIVVLVGLVMGIITPEKLAQWLGGKSGAPGVLLTGVVGAILHIPSIVAFPLAGSLLRSGASVTIIATFVATLTMIGVVTFPLEAKELGRRFALLRNGLSFLAALIIGWLMGAIL